MGTKKASLQKELVLEAYTRVGTVTHACRESGVSRNSFNSWLRRDARFRAAYEHAQEEAVESLEHEAHRRAVEGTLEPVYHRGKPVGAIRKYSDVLLIFLANPKKYRDNIRVDANVHANVNGNVLVNYGPLSKAELIDELTKRGMPTDILTGTDGP